MPPLKDLSGQRFGYLTVIRRNGTQNGHATWDCVCDCGNATIVPGISLTNGATKSCGCMTGKFVSEAKKTHGMSYHRLYSIWRDMRRRCKNPSRRKYDRYGGRGIRVCEEWNTSFYAFADWSYKNGYKDNLSIDRIDNDGDYCPENCRWVTMDIQANNKSVNHCLKYNGEIHTLKEWSDITGIPYSTIRSRANALHWDVESILTIKPGDNGWRNRKQYEHGKKVQCMETGEVFQSMRDAAEWCGLKRETGISQCCSGVRNTAGGYHWELAC